jgi:GR25 family glycosyltransferase involved in LPS biosynthesis
MTQYVILTVDDSRLELKQDIIRAMEETNIERTFARCVDGRIPGQIDFFLKENGLRVTGQPFHNGELGIWLSVVNTFYDFLIHSKDDALLIFEDDAVVEKPFAQAFPHVMQELPDDWDFFAWAIPADQKADYYYNRVFTTAGDWMIFNHIRHTYTGSPHYIPGKQLVCKTYQGYQAVAIQYSRRGMNKILSLIGEQGLHSPIDLFLFTEAFKGNLNAYTLLPDVYPMVTFVEKGTIARNSGMYN